jgi:RNA polymerase sigma factor (sigma-70 family)
LAGHRQKLQHEAHEEERTLGLLAASPRKSRLLAAPRRVRVAKHVKDAELERLVNAYAALIARAVRRVARAGAPMVLDDVQQNVLIGLWRQLERGQTIDRPASYIFRAAVRETVRLMRRERVQSPSDSTDPDLTPARTGAGANPHGDLEDKERQRALLEAIATLAPIRRLAVKAHLAGFDVREIMRMHGWSYQRARHLVARGMADLRAVLRERGIDE